MRVTQPLYDPPRIDSEVVRKFDEMFPNLANNKVSPNDLLRLLNGLITTSTMMQRGLLLLDKNDPFAFGALDEQVQSEVIVSMKTLDFLRAKFQG